ncbi:hypothetical protein HG536_0A09520 [Torulaspora globosa]|uniref:NTF2 domain-containing protein n=1 Tax=Torulaspora globosa TaxID=48254 RepID=A0A7G3ZC99_9SACH|nr:uncharacterized protein HG536_0A09520 [Torulaspora globosa]QLL31135.1 hypothetical protein HG536_0A09520 [Torulaspora globosa]
MGAAVQDIVYAFLETYYQRMKKDPSKVSSLYSATAELTHINYQIDFDTSSDILPTIKLTGKENISKFFTRNNKKVSDLKAKIDTCDFQTASHSGILILTTGEIFWSGTPAYRFCQTIVLQPNTDNKNAYDITNDVIRFIPDNWVAVPSPNEGSSKSKESKQPPESPVINGKAAVEERGQHEGVKAENEPELKARKSEAKSKGEADFKESTPLDQTISNELKSNSRTEEDISELKPINKSEKAVATEETDISEKETLQKDESDHEAPSTMDKQKEPDAPAQNKARPPARMSWASKLAASSDYIKTAPPVTSSQNGPAKPDLQVPSNKKIPESKTDLSSHRELSATKPVKKKPQFSTVNKDGFYPIYIKGTAGIKEEKLKKALESEFGTIMKMTTADSFAVVDFETQRSQVEALDRKQLMVGDTEVYLSRKTVKKTTGSPPAGSSNGSRSHKKHPNKKRD